MMRQPPQEIISSSSHDAGYGKDLEVTEELRLNHQILCYLSSVGILNESSERIVALLHRRKACEKIADLSTTATTNGCSTWSQQSKPTQRWDENLIVIETYLFLWWTDVSSKTVP